jgi:hypothetical protein
VLIGFEKAHWEGCRVFIEILSLTHVRSTWGALAPSPVTFRTTPKNHFRARRGERLARR